MNIILIGDSGHARVITDNLASCGHRVVARLDDKHAELVQQDGCWLGPVAEVHGLIEKEGAKVILAIGANAVRKKIVESLAIQPEQYAAAIHKEAVVSPSALIGPGTVVMPGAIVNAGAVVGQHAILNSRSVVEHDCTVGNFVHVSPGATVSGVVKLGEGVLIEPGASIVATKEVGQWSIVRAGSAVLDNVGEYATVIGVPAYVTAANS